MNGIELDFKDAIDLIDEIIDKCIVIDARTDSPYAELKNKKEFAEYIINKFLFKDNIKNE